MDSTNTPYGWIYCLRNPSNIDNLYKIGFTDKDPETRAKQLYTSGVAESFKIEFAKRVYDASEKERKLHRILKDYRYNNDREFFLIPDLQKVKDLFDLIDGEVWVEMKKEEKRLEVPLKTNDNKDRCTNMRECFTDGQRICHTAVGTNKTRYGVFDYSKNLIIFQDEDEEKFLTLNQFVVTHYKLERPNRNPAANAWAECKCEVNGEWVSVESQRPH